MTLNTLLNIHLANYFQFSILNIKKKKVNVKKEYEIEDKLILNGNC